MTLWGCWTIVAWLIAAQFVASLKLKAPLGNISFYLYQMEDGCDPTRTWTRIHETAREHPLRVLEEYQATFSLRCMVWNESAYLALPERTFPQFYLFWQQRQPVPYMEWSAAMRERKDFIFISFDRRPAANNTAIPMPGVTLPPASYTTRTYDPEKPPKYFMTFRGATNENQIVGKNNHLRKKILQAFKHYKKEGVVVEYCDKDCAKDSGERYKELLDSAFVLVPAGHGRWSHRLTEVIEACAIPVIMADGLTLPFEDLIDWGSIAIIVTESNITDVESTADRRFITMMMNPQKLINLLPRDPAVIKAKRKLICEFSRAYFGSQRKRFESLLLAAGVHTGILQNNSGHLDKPAFQFALK